MFYKKKEELIECVKKMFPSSIVDMEYIGATELMEMFHKNSELTLEVELIESPISIGGNNDSVVLMKLPKFYELITDENRQLIRQMFDANVRDYQGGNAVNSSIYDTLCNDVGNDFWWLNNGITIVCDKITPITQKRLSIINPYIVNGLQTSNEIYNYFNKFPDKSLNDNRNILVRFLAPKGDEIRDRIIFATNNQTNIPKSALRATDPIHFQIETYFKTRGIFYDRRKNYYKNQKKKTEDIISVSFLAQCLISIVLKQPDFARARPSTILADEEKYSELYRNHNDLEVYYIVAIIGRFVKKTLRKSEFVPSVQTDILFFIIYAYVAKVLNKRNIKFEDVKQVRIESICEDDVIEIMNMVYNQYVLLGGNNRVAKSNSFVESIDKVLFSE